MLQRYKKEIIQTNNLAKIEKIQRNNQSIIEKIQRNTSILPTLCIFVILQLFIWCFQIVSVSFPDDFLPIYQYINIANGRMKMKRKNE